MKKGEKNYSVDNENQIIFADVLALTEKEEKEILKFKRVGFSIKNRPNPTPKKEVHRINEKYILDQIGNDENAKKLYDNACKEEVKNKDGEKKIKKDGKTKTKGFSNGKIWFMKTYPTDDVDYKKIQEEVNNKIKEEYHTEYPDKELQKIYAKYKDQKQKEKEKEIEKEIDILTLEEYTKTYYWKNIFELPKEYYEEE